MDAQATTHRTYRKQRAMLGDERVPHFASLAKYAVAFLRNTLGITHWRQGISERLGVALEIGKHTASMPLVIGHCTGIAISHADAQGVVEEDSDLASGCRDRLLLSDPRCKAAIERA
ncbi:hypothetical protein IWQ51_006123 [Labrenzia sp. EL_142]|nr:hypothetical protein [Labrenzia sp. EL_142]